jgi:predicted Ser/Thr protein kinase
MIVNGIEFFKIIPKSGSTSNYYVDFEKKYFMKIPTRYKSYNVLEREIYILKMLKNYKWCPNLIYYDNNVIITEYCGEVLNVKNIPDDYELQIKKILSDLKKENIEHNDIHHGRKSIELLVKNKLIYLIDYGWCSINGDFSCGCDDISNKTKPHGITDDADIIKYIKKNII